MAIINLCIIIYGCMQADKHVFKHSGIPAFKQACFHITMQADVYICRLAFLPASLQACRQSRSQACRNTRRSEGAPAVSITKKKQKYFPRENRKRKKRKRKQSKRTGCRQAKRNRNKSRRVSCEERARHYAEVFLPDCESPSYLRFLFIISVDKNINNNRQIMIACKGRRLYVNFVIATVADIGILQTAF